MAGTFAFYISGVHKGIRRTGLQRNHSTRGASLGREKKGFLLESAASVYFSQLPGNHQVELYIAYQYQRTKFPTSHSVPICKMADGRDSLIPMPKNQTSNAIIVTQPLLTITSITSLPQLP